LSTVVDILRAKSENETNYHLKDHLFETIGRAIQLKDFINQNKSVLEYNKFNDSFFENLIKACFLHDLGKINWKFQLKLFDEKEKEYDSQNRSYKDDKLKQLSDFFDGFRDVNVKDHEVISLIYTLLFLDNNEWDRKIRTAILLHHYNEFYTNVDINIRYVFDDYPDLTEYLRFLIDKENDVADILSDLLDYAENKITDSSAKNVLGKLKNKMNFNRVKDFKESVDTGIGLSAKLRMFNVPDKEDQSFYDFFVFLGCLRRCDYSASGSIKIEDVQNLDQKVYKDLDGNIRNRVAAKHIWQEDILAKYAYDNLVLIAPTGSGKTEFALLWAKNRGKKLIYTLPLRVALNDLYWRFANNNNGYFNSNYLRILHSTSFIEYLKEEKEGEELNIDEKQATAELFSSPLILSTPDQVFLSSLKYYGFDKLVSVYPFSAVVIDEIQAYNPEMAAVIIKAVDIIKKVCGNLLIITATFPPYFENYFSEEKGFNKIDLENEDAKLKDQIKNYNLQRHKIELSCSQVFEYKSNEDQKTKYHTGKETNEENLKINSESFERIKEILVNNDSKNILIIVNNVGKAINLYKKLEVNCGELKVEKENLYLLHSRLLEKEKDRRINNEEEGIKGKLNKIFEKRDKGNEIKSSERIVLIATQIVEASIDVDFDVLITEISPIDSQIQRWGRIYRNRNNDYAEDEANVLIFTGSDRGTTAIYDRRTIEKTIEVLKNYQGQFLDYEQERKIIKEVFDSKIDNNHTLKDVFSEEIDKNLEWLEYYSIEKRSEAQRIFRKIGGVQVVVPQLMEDENDVIQKTFAKIIGDSQSRELLWNAIISEIKGETSKNVDIWHLKKLLFDYSFNLPIFSFEEEKIKHGILRSVSFKGFFILNIKDTNKLEEFKKYGINTIKDIDIDNLEIEESGSADII